MSIAYLDPNMKVLLYTGKIKRVGDLNSEDVLMGHDSKPLNISSISEEMVESYELITPKDDKIIIGGDHSLSFKVSCKNAIYWKEKRHAHHVFWREGYKGKCKTFSIKKYKTKEKAKAEAEKFFSTLNESKGTTFELKFVGFINLKTSEENISKLYKTGLDFPYTNITLDPYFLGLWLGDGDSNGPCITTEDDPISEWLYRYVASLNMRIRHSNKNRYHLRSSKPKPGSNIVLNELRNYKILNNKRIPEDFLYNSREIRLQVLAGLMDSDGYYHNNYYEIFQKRKRLAEDILYLARSLGFGATIRACLKTCTNGANGRVTGTYHRVNIYGAELEDIPVLLSRKKGRERKQIKDALVHGISYEELGIQKCVKIEFVEDSHCMSDNFLVV